MSQITHTHTHTNKEKRTDNGSVINQFNFTQINFVFAKLCRKKVCACCKWWRHSPHTLPSVDVSEMNDVRCAYLVALYNGHPGHAQHSSSVRMASATSTANAMSNQNSILFSAL